MPSHPNPKPWSNKPSEAPVTVACLLQSNDLPVCSPIGESAISQSIVRTHCGGLLSLQHVLLNMMVSLHWQIWHVERSRINLKPNLIILFLITGRFSCQHALTAMTKEAFRNAMAAPRNKYFSTACERIVWAGSPSPARCTGPHFTKPLIFWNVDWIVSSLFLVVVG